MRFEKTCAICTVTNVARHWIAERGPVCGSETDTTCQFVDPSVSFYSTLFACTFFHLIAFFYSLLITEITQGLGQVTAVPAIFYYFSLSISVSGRERAEDFFSFFLALRRLHEDYQENHKYRSSSLFGLTIFIILKPSPSYVKIKKDFFYFRTPLYTP